MTRRDLLKPDSEGHYSPQALALDAVSSRNTPSGKHPLDNIANEMAAEHSRRSLFATGARGIGALALASLLGGDRAEGRPCRIATFCSESKALHLPASCRCPSTDGDV